MGGRKTIAGGELYVYSCQNIKLYYSIKVAIKNYKSYCENMKKFEYRVENISAKDFSNQETVKEVKDFLSEMGTNGWEMITIIPTSQFEESGLTGKRLIMKNSLLIFKREVT